MYKLIYHKVFSAFGTEYSIPRGLEIGGKEVIFPCSIKTNADRKAPFIVEIDSLVIVNFYPWDKFERENANKQGIDLNRNIWAFDSKGNKVWEVAEATVKIRESNPYTSVSIKNGKVIGGCIDSDEYIIDISNGNVERIPPNGRPW